MVPEWLSLPGVCVIKGDGLSSIHRGSFNYRKGDARRIDADIVTRRHPDMV